MGGPYPYGHGWEWNIGRWLMWPLMLIAWAIVAVGIMALVRGWPSHGARPPKPEAPLQALERRYAAGELTQEQFDAAKRDIA